MNKLLLIFTVHLFCWQLTEVFTETREALEETSGRLEATGAVLSQTRLDLATTCEDLAATRQDRDERGFLIQQQSNTEHKLLAEAGEVCVCVCVCVCITMP